MIVLELLLGAENRVMVGEESVPEDVLVLETFAFVELSLCFVYVEGVLPTEMNMEDRDVTTLLSDGVCSITFVRVAESVAVS